MTGRASPYAISRWTLRLTIFTVVCMEEEDGGPCRGYFQRWAFNPQKLMCLPFAYGGCRGNRNNFLTSDECNETCGIVSASASSGSQEHEELACCYL